MGGGGGSCTWGGGGLHWDGGAWGAAPGDGGAVPFLGGLHLLGRGMTPFLAAHSCCAPPTPPCCSLGSMLVGAGGGDGGAGGAPLLDRFLKVSGFKNVKSGSRAPSWEARRGLSLTAVGSTPTSTFRPWCAHVPNAQEPPMGLRGPRRGGGGRGAAVYPLVGCNRRH